jgi:hypothetical protein
MHCKGHGSDDAICMVYEAKEAAQVDFTNKVVNVI